MTTLTGGDYFDRARLVAVGLILLAATIAISGSFLNWVVIEERPGLVPGAEFDGEEIAPPEVEPVTGVEARDGWYVIAAAVIMAVSALLLVFRHKGSYAVASLLCAIAIGGISFADYRQVGDLRSEMAQRLEIVGEPAAGIGLLLVVAGGILGILGSVGALVATPRRENGH